MKQIFYDDVILRLSSFTRNYFLSLRLSQKFFATYCEGNDQAKDNYRRAFYRYETIEETKFRKEVYHRHMNLEDIANTDANEIHIVIHGQSTVKTISIKCNVRVQKVSMRESVYKMSCMIMVKYWLCSIFKEVLCI